MTTPRSATQVFFMLLHLGAGLFFFTSKTVAQINWADTLVAKSLIEEVRQLHQDANHTAALEKSEQALNIYTRLYGPDHFQTARARMFAARACRYLQREQEAITLYEQSLPTLEANGNVFLLARCHQGIALCHRGMSQFNDAYIHLEKAIAILRADSSNQAVNLADMFVTLGSVYNSEKKYQPAIPVLEQAKAVYQQYNNNSGLGFAAYHLGGAWFGLQDYVRAKEQYLTALANLQNRLKPSHSYFADLYVKFGLCQQKTGASEVGLRYLLEAKAAYLADGGEGLNYMQFLQDLGQFYINDGRYIEAVEQLQQCLALREKEHGKANFHLLGTLRVLGEACMGARQFDLAERCSRRGLQIINSGLPDGYRFRYLFYSQLAKLRLAQGDISGCLLLCDTTFVVAGFDTTQREKMVPRDHFRELCQLKAQALVEQWRTEADTARLVCAERYFALAAQTLFREVEEITVHSSRELFYDRDHLVLEQWLDTQMALFEVSGAAEHAEAAFQIASQSKAFLLSEAMRRSGALRFAGVPDSILQQELSLRELIADAEKALHNAAMQPSSQIDSFILVLNQQLAQNRIEYDDLLRYIELNYPAYFQLRLLHPEISTSALRNIWLAPDQALLQYSFTDSRLYAFVLTRDTFCIVPLPFRPDLDSLLDAFRQSVTTYFTAADPDDALYDQSLGIYIKLGQLLYRDLVLPVAQLLPNRVVIIPDRKLWYLPFEALLTSPPTDEANFRTYPFWAKNKALSYALAPEFLVNAHQHPTPEPGNPWLGLAPFANISPFEGSAVQSRSNSEFEALPASGTEVKTIGALLKGEYWLNAEASPGRFQREAPNYRILHLATHSRADDRLGDFTYLATSQTGEPMPAKDLYQMALRAEMVVLSACETGGGQLLRGEGIIGLVRAFTFAGAQSTIASLWLANDQATASLMIGFYKNLLQGMPKDVALQSSARQLADHTPAQAHPFFWAGFRVYGGVGRLW
ncbi:MAG: CHAT domain-containing protein [Lewinellaceae bacterium]|nr:CHAT domain-containing protein [Saprospiraceae bacterium]MCB9334231.1 CHAT domain-containing protein [Lewinellaceae bacterium]